MSRMKDFFEDKKMDVRIKFEDIVKDYDTLEKILDDGTLEIFMDDVEMSDYPAGMVESWARDFIESIPQTSNIALQCALDVAKEDSMFTALTLFNDAKEELIDYMYCILKDGIRHWCDLDEE